MEGFVKKLLFSFNNHVFFFLARIEAKHVLWMSFLILLEIIWKKYKTISWTLIILCFISIAYIENILVYKKYRIYYMIEIVIKYESFPRIEMCYWLKLCISQSHVNFSSILFYKNVEQHIFCQILYCVSGKLSESLI